MIEILQEQFFLAGMILLAVSFFYSSVGHGGASAYLAIFVLWNIPTELIRPTALMMNIAVSVISFALFAKAQHFRWKLFLPFALTSIPAAFVGGMISIDAGWYKIILAVFILLAILPITGMGNQTTESKPINITLARGIGILIGLSSGLIGIGGGIILSPVILLLRWGNLKQTAAVSALFILVNSISGLIGHLIHAGTMATAGFDIIPFVLIGSILGSFYGSHSLSSYKLKYVLQLVLFMACFKLIIFP